MVAPSVTAPREGHLNAPDPLAQLRDVHLPEPISAWPPAPGWWFLALLSLVGTLMLVRYFWQRHQRRAYIREAKVKLQALLVQQLTPQRQLHLANDILKRCAITAYPGQPVASLSGEAWLIFLNQHSKTQLFGVPSRWLASWYKQEVPHDLSQDFIQRAIQWVEQQPRSASRV